MNLTTPFPLAIFIKLCFSVLTYKKAYNTIRVLKPEYLSISFVNGLNAYDTFVSTLKEKAIPTPNSIYFDKIKDEFSSSLPLLKLIYVAFPSNTGVSPYVSIENKLVFVNPDKPPDFANVLNFSFIFRNNQNIKFLYKIFNDYWNFKDQIKSFLDSYNLKGEFLIKDYKDLEISLNRFAKQITNGRSIKKLIKTGNSNLEPSLNLAVRKLDNNLTELGKKLLIEHSLFLLDGLKNCDNNDQSINEYLSKVKVEIKNIVLSWTLSDDDFAFYTISEEKLSLDSGESTIESIEKISVKLMNKFVHEKGKTGDSAFKHFLDIFREAIVDELRHLELPKMLPEEVIAACINRKLNFRKDLINLYMSLHEGYFKYDKEQTLKIIKGDPIEIIDDESDRIEKAYSDNLKNNLYSPYMNIKPFETGHAFQIVDGKILRPSFTFCVETAIRHLLNLVLYDYDLKNFNLENVKNQKLIEFFTEIQPLEKINVDDCDTINTDWNKIVSNLPKNVEYKFKNNNEIKPTIANVYNVIAHLFGLEQKKSLTEEEFEVEIIKVIKFINPKSKIKECKYQNDKNEFLFTLSDKIWTFTLYIDISSNHAKVDINEPSLLPKDEFYQNMKLIDREFNFKWMDIYFLRSSPFILPIMNKGLQNLETLKIDNFTFDCNIIINIFKRGLNDQINCTYDRNSTTLTINSSLIKNISFESIFANQEILINSHSPELNVLFNSNTSYKEVNITGSILNTLTINSSEVENVNVNVDVINNVILSDEVQTMNPINSHVKKLKSANSEFVPEALSYEEIELKVSSGITPKFLKSLKCKKLTLNIGVNISQISVNESVEYLELNSKNPHTIDVGHLKTLICPMNTIFSPIKSNEICEISFLKGHDYRNINLFPNLDKFPHLTQISFIGNREDVEHKINHFFQKYLSGRPEIKINVTEDI